jgi:hypothetical protein
MEEAAAAMVTEMASGKTVTMWTRRSVDVGKEELAM